MDEMQRTEREVEIDRIDVRLRVGKDAVANQIQTFINVLSVEYHESFVFITTVNNIGKETKVMIPLDAILIMETVTTPGDDADMPVIQSEGTQDVPLLHNRLPSPEGLLGRAGWSIV